MAQTTDIFEKHYDDYCAQISKVDFLSVKDRLGIEVNDDQIWIRFADERYTVTGSRIADSLGRQPDYAICVVLFKYTIVQKRILDKKML